ncbi:MAG: sortase [Nitriliruptorales bacterium]|nr:sortase [Nitriliruptorales bacterium]
MTPTARRILPIALLLLGVGMVAAGLGVFSGTNRLSINDSPAPPLGRAAGVDAPAPSPSPAPAADGTSTAPVSLAELADIGRASAASLPRGITPVRIEVPTIGVDADVVTLGRKNAEEIEVPHTAEQAGWYTPSRRPGEIGPAIIAGHVDLDGGPAVFHRLRELAAGDTIIVHGDDGKQVTFVVATKGQYPKDGLPDNVFGFDGARPELRLITCGGVFNHATGHYEDNVVVYAHQEL